MRRISLFYLWTEYNILFIIFTLSNVTYINASILETTFLNIYMVNLVLHIEVVYIFEKNELINILPPCIVMK